MGGALFLAGVLGGARPALAQEAPPADAERVTFSVSVCLARDGDAGVDAECEAIQAQLPVRVGTLEIQQQGRFELAFGEPSDVRLPTGALVNFRPLSILQGKLHMHIAMPGVVDTRLQLDRGRSVILAGVPHQDGTLIIELRPVFSEPPAPPPSILVEDSGPPAPTKPEVRRVGAPRVGGR